MESYFELLLFFTIYAFLGWTMETIFASVKAKKFINRGFLTGFFCPIYGVGAILAIQSSKWIDTFLSYNYKSLIVSILFSILLVTLLEYITGMLLEKIFKCKWWDYSSEVANVKGYICVKYSLLWGVLAFLLVRVLHAVILNIVIAIPVMVKEYVAIFLTLYFLVDTSKSAFDALNLRKVVLHYSKFSLNDYYEKIFKHKRFFLAFPGLLRLNADIINRDVRSILNDKLNKIKNEIKNKIEEL